MRDEEVPERQGVWLYAVTRDPAPEVLGELTGVSAETPRLVEAAGLAAVVGDVPLSSFGEAALRRNFEDLDWLAPVARAHDSVIVALIDRGPAIPIRLATVYHGDDRVRHLLEHRAVEFTRALDQVTGRTEWGVKIFLAPAPDPVPAAGGPSPRGAGAAYLARRRATLNSREHQERRAVEQANRAHAALASLAVDTRTHPPQSRALAGEDARMILNGAYLVDNEHTLRFAEATAACDQDNDAILVRLTGPWPPYSFSVLEEA
ncbi:GvpL/GvpF family gas vesicle protein [Amycolatopsis sp. NPDC051128]|uniref:GvpL/GvpF family gas vesicle protein n=1 Tax=Amycolatopsis sp. NPDC051128 TaxID=3155412 RepID=UPI003440FD68